MKKSKGYVVFHVLSIIVFSLAILGLFNQKIGIGYGLLALGYILLRTADRIER